VEKSDPKLEKPRHDVGKRIPKWSDTSLKRFEGFGLVSRLECIVMSTEIISIRVDAEAARAFKALPEEDRRRLEALLSIRLSEITHGGESLEAVMQEISDKAKARGLTPKILNSLLNDE
jgi:hypothetical protein